MSTPKPKGHSRSGKLHLRAAQTLVLSQANIHRLMSIEIMEGVLRLSTVEMDGISDVTLALMSPIETGVFRHPTSRQLQIEAITDSYLEIFYEVQQNINEEDFLSNWLMELHLIRHPAKAEERLKALLQLLIERFGKRTLEGFKLEFLLPHARIAEIIGTTRSTVSRSLSGMRKKNFIQIDELKGTLIMDEKYINAFVKN